MKAYDMLVQAEGGLCSVTGTPESPSKIGVSAADISTGSNAHAAILEALIERSKSGHGQNIEISMFDGIADWMSVPLLHFEHSGIETGRYGLSHASIYPYRPFDCTDGTIIIAVQNNGEWTKLCLDALGRSDLLEMTEFASNPLRVKKRVALVQILEPIIAELSFDQAVACFNSAGIAWARYTEIRDLGRHQALRRMEVTLPDGDAVSLPRPAGRAAGFSAGKIPKLGENTQAIRSEFGSQ